MKLNVLISIKPQYTKEILLGNKRYEYRKRIFKEEVDKIYIYSTSPEQKIVGYFKYKGYKMGTPEELWEETNLFSGINKEAYFEYFEGRKEAYAIQIEEVYEFDRAIEPKEAFEKFTAPQSYMYLKGDIV